jgi:hypothetical protein
LLEAEGAWSIVRARQWEPFVGFSNHSVVISHTSCLENRQLLEREIVPWGLDGISNRSFLQMRLKTGHPKCPHRLGFVKPWQKGMLPVMSW